MPVDPEKRLESLRKLAATLIVHSELPAKLQDEWLSLTRGMILPDFERLAKLLDGNWETDGDMWRRFREQVREARQDYEHRLRQMSPRPFTARELLQQMFDDYPADSSGP